MYLDSSSSLRKLAAVHTRVEHTVSMNEIEGATRSSETSRYNEPGEMESLLLFIVAIVLEYTVC